MLHAANANKTRLASLYRDGERKTLEDLITSTVFGPLDFLSNTDRDFVVNYLVERLGLPTKTARHATLHFWQRHDESAFRQRVFPDLLIDLGNGGKIIVEVKWGAALSENELAAQWSALTPKERAGSAHVLLVKSASAYRSAVAAERRALKEQLGAEWGSRLIVITWRALADKLLRLRSDPRNPEHLRRWADACVKFLHREDRSTVGWDHMALEHVESLRWSFMS